LIATIPTWTAKIPQQHMAIQVCELTNQTKSKSNLHLKITNRGVKGMVHIVCDKGTKGPIISTISKHIGEWRGCMAKSVHKKCFHDAFEIVEAPVVQCICLNWVDDSLPLVAKKLVDWEVVKNRIEHQRTQVFTEKECAVGNLWTQVLENNS